MDEQYVPKPDSNMVIAVIGAIMGFLCCCLVGLPTGIVAIVKASKVNELYMAGQYDAARKASEEAKMYGLISIGLGVVGFIISFIAGFMQGYAGC